jgi:hypothetical protein
MLLRTADNLGLLLIIVAQLQDAAELTSTLTVKHEFQ